MSDQTLSAPMEVHIICVAVIILLGTLTNGVLLFIYFKKGSKDIGSVYLATLAILDLAACFTPIFIPLLKLLHENSDTSTYYLILNSCNYVRGFVRINNLHFTCLMAIDRLFAVFKPLKYKYFISHARKIIAVIMALSLIQMISFFIFPRSVLSIMIGLHVFIGLITVFTAYPLIAYKIYIRDKRRIGGNGSSHTNGNLTMDTNLRYALCSYNDLTF